MAIELIIMIAKGKLIQSEEIVHRPEILLLIN
jgi:hypothetical protein